MLAAAIAASEQDQNDLESERARREADEMEAALAASRDLGGAARGGADGATSSGADGATSSGASASEPAVVGVSSRASARSSSASSGGPVRRSNRRSAAGASTSGRAGGSRNRRSQRRPQINLADDSDDGAMSLDSDEEFDHGFGGASSADPMHDPMLAAAIALSRGASGAADPHDMMAALLGGGGPLGGARGPVTYEGLWHAELQCVSSEALDMGDAMRDGDKVLLPPEALEQLMRLIPPDQMPSPMLFCLSRLDEVGRRHVGVLEFSAPAGCVVVPLWLMRGLGATDGMSLRVETAELPRGTFAKLQPLDEHFVTLPDPKAALESSIGGVRSTLSMGDSILVEHEGRQLEVFVVELRPADTVCVVDTELEVDFALAFENEEERRQRADQLDSERRLAEEALRQQQAEEEERARARAAEAAVAEREAEVARRAVQTSELPPEPPASADATTVLVRMPDGPRISRRFAKETPLQIVRTWVVGASPPERPMRDFELVSNYPRFAATAANQALTLDSSGLHPQATLFVRDLAAEVEAYSSGPAVVQNTESRVAPRIS